MAVSIDSERIHASRSGWGWEGDKPRLIHAILNTVNGPRLIEIVLDVPGWPPIKNEAASMLAAGHPQRERVRLLLENAAAAIGRTGWKPVSTDIALEVVVRTPTPRPPGDATNFLGGIGDVLQDKTAPRNIDLSHLGAIQAVALYHDDRQICQINYRIVSADTPSYQVRVTQLAAPA